jgi:hypothetical protein
MKIRRVTAGANLFSFVNLGVCVIGFRLCGFVGKHWPTLNETPSDKACVIPRTEKTYTL